ncbi:efflux RND transporter periplasmic adaptor subunit [Derxia gummosa]|uniref:Efflux RND transporter periplasmic adaptor subunit n=1 Tax=Derxia gummosa DSM 723 TaxID=1121388 RepID=A0A8B6X841_9BURK|nr:efflux RND transporter periplasmic adaptor subunit [Derxia gummosa]
MADQPSPPASAPALGALRIDRDPQRGTPPRRRGRWKWALGALVVAAAVGAGVLRSANAPREVELATVALAWPSQGITELNATGRVVAQTRANVSSKATGRLMELNVTEGQAVKAGDVIARLESAEADAARQQAAAAIRQARANLEQGEAERTNAEAELARTRDLARQNFVSQSAVDAAAARADKARATIGSLRAAIGVAEANARTAEVAFEYTLIRAPFDGVVLTKNANVGDILTPFSAAAGTTGAVVSMADMRTLEVEADVAESGLAKVHVGQSAEIQLDAWPDLRLEGRVNRIVPTVDRSKATLLVKVSFVDRDERVLPDMNAKIAFLARALAAEERKPVVAVRREAVVEREGRRGVFVAGADGKAGFVPVTTGTALGDLVQAEGLKPGDRVVLRPDERLRDGAAVVARKD